MNRKQRRVAQKLGGSTAPATRATPVPELFAAGVRQHQAGQLAVAERLYREVLAVEPRHADACHLLGVIAHQLGRHQEAVERIGEALALDEGMPQAHNNRALALRALGQIDQATEHFARAVQIKPDYAEAHSNLGAALLGRGQWERAALHCRSALALRPDLPSAALNLGRALLALGRSSDALGAACHALAQRDSPEARDLFLDCVVPAHITADDGTCRALVLRALSEGWDRPSELMRPAVSLLRLSTPIRTGIERATRAWPARVPPAALLAPATLQSIATDRLLRALLESGPIADAGVEQFLVSLRAMILDRAAAARDVADDELALACALARQCFSSEYVFVSTAEETAKADRLRARILATLADDAAVSPVSIAAVAAYAPLGSLPGADRLVARPWPAMIAALLRQQIDEPAREQRLRAAIPVLTSIDDAVSRAVRGQYETTPYPRWTKAVPARQPLLPSGLETGDILVAGCGTGQFAIELGRQVPQARILAIDLSLNSLAYAARMTQEAGLVNIEYAQADLLQLATIGRSFDVIEAGGVLHHLADPWAGWQALLAILRPRGLMRIGIYSALARRDIAEVRDFIAAQGYAATPSDIRRCRAALMGFADHTAQHHVTRWGDFFSMSGCRDLLLHVQEHCVTLPEIKAFLEQNALEFLQFDLDAHLADRFVRRCPGPADLDRWHAFETENPATFVDMYQFWIRRRH